MKNLGHLAKKYDLPIQVKLSCWEPYDQGESLGESLTELCYCSRGNLEVQALGLQRNNSVSVIWLRMVFPVLFKAKQLLCLFDCRKLFITSLLSNIQPWICLINQEKNSYTVWVISFYKQIFFTNSFMSILINCI